MGICAKEEEERLQEPEGIGGFKVIASTMHNWTDTHMNLQRLWQTAKDLHRFKEDKITALKRGNRNKVSPIAKKLFAIYLHWQREKSVFSIGTSLGILSTTQRRPVPRNSCLIQMGTIFIFVVFHFMYFVLYIFVYLFWFSFCFVSEGEWETDTEKRKPRSFMRKNIVYRNS